MPLDISEYQNMAGDGYGNVIPTGKEPAIAFQQLAVGGSSTQSSPFNDAARFVRLHTDVACRIQFGPNPTASATTMRMAAGSTEFFGVVGGQRIAVITST